MTSLNRAALSSLHGRGIDFRSDHGRRTWEGFLGLKNSQPYSDSNPLSRHTNIISDQLLRPDLTTSGNLNSVTTPSFLKAFSIRFIRPSRALANSNLPYRVLSLSLAGPQALRRQGPSWNFADVPTIHRFKKCQRTPLSYQRVSGAKQGP